MSQEQHHLVLLLFGLIACTSAVFGLFFNAYIVVALFYGRQVAHRPSSCSSSTALHHNNLLLLHLALVDLLTCVEILASTVPSAVILMEGNEGKERTMWSSSLSQEGKGEGSGGCQVHGFVWMALLPVAMWTLCGLNCDRYAAIASPLHYTRVVRRRLIFIFLGLVWTIGVALALPPLIFEDTSSYTFSSGTLCVADFSNIAAVAWYPLVYACASLIAPASLILFCNLRLLLIARHHHHRIVSAIYEVTLRAQATITHQRNPPPPSLVYPGASAHKGRCAIAQLLGALLVTYGPQGALTVWEGVGGRGAGSTVRGFTATLVACSPPLNAFVYGIKSRVLRKTFKNLLRRRLYAFEVKNEIRQRRASTVTILNAVPQPPMTPSAVRSTGRWSAAAILSKMRFPHTPGPPSRSVTLHSKMSLPSSPMLASDMNRVGSRQAVAILPPLSLRGPFVPRNPPSSSSSSSDDDEPPPAPLMKTSTKFPKQHIASQNGSSFGRVRSASLKHDRHLENERCHCRTSLEHLGAMAVTQPEIAKQQWMQRAPTRTVLPSEPSCCKEGAINFSGINGSTRFELLSPVRKFASGSTTAIKSPPLIVRGSI